MTYAEIALPIPLRKTFTYRVPEGIKPPQKGSRVKVPFHGRILTGFVVELKDENQLTCPVEKIKTITEVIDETPLVNEEMMNLARELGDYYLVSFGNALKLFVPSAIKAPPGEEWLVISPEGRKAVEALTLSECGEENRKKRLTQAQKMLLQYLANNDGAPVSALRKMFSLSASPVKTLLKHGLARKLDYKFAGRTEEIEVLKGELELNELQKEIVEKVLEKSCGFRSGDFLIHGVTGSGKTNIYIALVAEALKKGFSATVLVPEISLTPQTVERFSLKLGVPVRTWHSFLSISEKKTIRNELMSGKVRVLVGARSAVLAPMHRLGLIVIDEEHETGYKQDENINYDARTVARMRLRNGGTVVSGSATPSLESYYRARMSGQLFEMRSRIDSRPLPQTTIIDMKEEFKVNRSIFSRQLKEAIRQALLEKKQVILFLNRRGHSTFVFCRECGYTVKCPGCSIALTLHMRGEIREEEEKNRTASSYLSCHYCGHRESIPKLCPSCSSKYIRYFGGGTERVEEETRRLFPAARTVRIDSDTVASQGHEVLLGSFARHEADILIGTQMIGKGLDYPRVTVVGVISADVILNMPDFRAAERTFQMITQVAGRAGRADFHGKVFVQTYNADNYVIKAAAAHDYDGFASCELEYRRILRYPPYVRLINLEARSRSLENAENALLEIRRKLEQLTSPAQTASLFEKDSPEILGPAPAPIAMLRGEYRFNLLIKTSTREEVFKDVRRTLEKTLEETKFSGDVTLTADVDPVSLL